MARKKTDKQALFIENYLHNGFNQTQAYIDAGYKCSRNVAAVQANRLLRKPNIREEINKRVENIVIDEKELTAKWIQEVKRLAFSDLREAVTWNGQSVNLKDSKTLNDDIAATISEVSETNQGIRIKKASKEKALELLGKYLCILKENVDVRFPEDGYKNLTDKELIERKEQLLNKVKEEMKKNIKKKK